VGARFAEHGRPVVAGVAAVPPGRISGAPGCPGDTPGPPGPAALALVEDVLEPADRRHPGVRRTGDGGDEQAVHRPGRFPGHLGQRHAPPAARGVVPVAPAGIVEREAQRRLLVGRQRGDEAPRPARHRRHGRALVQWVSAGSEALLEVGPAWVRRLGEPVARAEATGTDEARLAAYEELRGLLGWLAAGLDEGPFDADPSDA